MEYGEVELYRRAVTRFKYDVESLLELPERLSERTVIDASVPLRRLLTDKLAGRANAVHRVALTFSARQMHRAEVVLPILYDIDELKSLGYSDEAIEFDRSNPVYWQGHVLDPMQPDHEDPDLQADTVTLNLDQWIAHKIGCLSGAYVSVRDVVKHVANIHGGVHVSPIKTHLEADFNESQQLGKKVTGIGPVHAIVHIAAVTARGLLPLYERLQGKDQPRHPSLAPNINQTALR